MLAEQTAIIDAHDAYKLGLLHDVGEALLYTLFPREMENILWLSDEARINREVAAFGVDHAQVGQWMFESCGIPRQLTAAVQTHHDALRINAPIALLLHVANVIARAKDPRELAAVDSLGSERLTMLGLSRPVLAGIQERTTAAIEQHLAVPC
jgi:HD-like signal output (HDOD) protein